MDLWNVLTSINCLLRWETKEKELRVCLYVDDIILIGNCTAMISEFKKSMMNEFEVFDMGLMHYILYIEVI